MQLAQQVAENFVDGPLAWYELTEAVTRRLVDEQTAIAWWAK
jgi:hypothetical protein